MAETASLFKRLSCDEVCPSNQEKVYKCYKENASKSLKCAEEVENFSRCVDNYRLVSYVLSIALIKVVYQDFLSLQHSMIKT